MTYENYLGFSREVLLEKMRQILPEKRLTHCLGVEKAARDLAKRYGADEEQAGLAGLLHDYAKKLSDQEFLDLIDRYELDPALKNWGNNVWHGMVGIYKIQEDLGLTDPAILRSIEIHTVGSDQMSTLDKIVYVADYIEHNRPSREWIKHVISPKSPWIVPWPMRRLAQSNTWPTKDCPFIPKPSKPIMPL